MKVASDFLRPALSSVYEVAGRFLLLDVSDAPSARTIHRFLTRWHLTLLSGQTARLDARIIVRLGPLPSAPIGFEKFPLMDGAVGYATDTSYRIDFGSSVLEADESNVVNVWLENPLHDDHAELSQLVSHALSAALRRCSVFELHSAAVVDESSGSSVLICGPSGSGKSTLTLQLAAAGWRYLSDDVLLLGLTGEKVKATGLRRFFALTLETVEMIALPQIKALLEDADSFRKLPLVADEIFPSGWLAECQPNAILFSSVGEEQRTTIRSLSSAETMSKLIRLCPWSCYDRAVARNFLDVLGKLVKQSSSFELVAGADLLGEPARTAQMLINALQKKRA
jgi:hypothetical protein